jgi:hypothetical protein
MKGFMTAVGNSLSNNSKKWWLKTAPLSFCRPKSDKLESADHPVQLSGNFINVVTLGRYWLLFFILTVSDQKERGSSGSPAAPGTRQPADAPQENARGISQRGRRSWSRRTDQYVTLFHFLQALCNIVHFAINEIDFSLFRTEKHAGDSGERVEDSDREQVRGAVKYFTLHLMMHLNKPSPCPTLDLYSHYLRTLNKNTETSPFLWIEKKQKQLPGLG